ncbi:MAG: ABC transporter [Bacteroidetes bacterium QS_8_64_10]|nr:MAG: ABC transporter [Bacteroidetes bacterium QS_8_64_10]
MRVTSAMPAIGALWKREMLKFVRDWSRVLGALAQPIGLWLLLGFGFEGTFRLPAGGPQDVGYMEFLFPGIVALIVLFTAIYSTISLVEDRKTGFLQAALAAPAPRSALVLGTALGGTTLALAQALLFLLLIPLVGLSASAAGVGLLTLTVTLVGLGFTALGFVIAWRIPSTRGFHGVMMMVLIPLWLLSGAFFPANGASPVLRTLMAANPVSYAVSALRQALYWPEAAPSAFASLPVCLTVTAAFAALMLGLAIFVARRQSVVS